MRKKAGGWLGLLSSDFLFVELYTAGAEANTDGTRQISIMDEKAISDAKARISSDKELLEQDVVDEKHVDKAYEFMKHHAAGPLSAVDDKRILRKIDRNLLPLVPMIHFL